MDSWVCTNWSTGHPSTRIVPRLGLSLDDDVEVSESIRSRFASGASKEGATEGGEAVGDHSPGELNEIHAVAVSRHRRDTLPRRGLRSGTVSGDLIPCPVCGDELHVVRSGPTKYVDCVHRHHATTDPALYEELRLRVLLAELEHFLRPGTEQPSCTAHEWTSLEEFPDLVFVICRRCLAVSAGAGSR